jgi:hypothetical protein
MGRIKGMGKIAEVLVGLLDGEIEKPEMSEPIPLNRAAQISHKKHKIVLDEMWKKGRALEDQLNEARRAVAEEMQRWAKEMGEVQPELKDTTYFEITDDSTFFKVPVEEMKTEVKTPEWAKGASKTVN